MEGSLSKLAILLLKGVVYAEDDAGLWGELIALQNRLRDHFAVLALELLIDEAEGYAFLRSRRAESETESDEGVPRLVARRPLSFPVSLLLALLRRRLAESDAEGGSTRLVLGRDEVVEMLRVFLPPTANEARLVDQIDGHLRRIAELGFLRPLKAQRSASEGAQYEVRRILKAFVDAQWLSDFDARLAAYQAELAHGASGGSDA